MTPVNNEINRMLAMISAESGMTKAEITRTAIRKYAETYEQLKSMIAAREKKLPNTFSEKGKLWVELTKHLFCAGCIRKEDGSSPFSHRGCSGCDLVNHYEKLGGFRI